ncbi:MAG: aldehyde dehydrogenase family protein [Ferruginibacter sp.]
MQIKHRPKRNKPCIDGLIYYSGWCDKFQQLFSTVNRWLHRISISQTPSLPGCCSHSAAENSLLGIVSLIAPIIAGGNTCVVLASNTKPLCAVTFAEVLNSSDLPGGVVNILTGKVAELAPYFADHMDVNATVYCETDAATQNMIKEKSALNVKRVVLYDKVKWNDATAQSPYFIMDLQEIKTTWHPIENIGGAKAGY